jgi:hypothetical protein
MMAVSKMPPIAAPTAIPAIAPVDSPPCPPVLAPPLAVGSGGADDVVLERLRVGAVVAELTVDDFEADSRSEAL